jgi:hypothetical protein
MVGIKVNKAFKKYDKCIITCRQKSFDTDIRLERRSKLIYGNKLFSNFTCTDKPGVSVWGGIFNSSVHMKRKLQF